MQGKLGDQRRQLHHNWDTIRMVRPRRRVIAARGLVKTHEEISSFEIDGLIEKSSPDVIDVLLDHVDFAVRLEDPLGR